MTLLARRFGTNLWRETAALKMAAIASAMALAIVSARAQDAPPPEPAPPETRYRLDSFSYLAKEGRVRWEVTTISPDGKEIQTAYGIAVGTGAATRNGKPMQATPWMLLSLLDEMGHTAILLMNIALDMEGLPPGEEKQDPAKEDRAAWLH